MSLWCSLIALWQWNLSLLGNLLLKLRLLLNILVLSYLKLHHADTLPNELGTSLYTIKALISLSLPLLAPFLSLADLSGDISRRFNLSA